jgi:hypothetical protein
MYCMYIDNQVLYWQEEVRRRKIKEEKSEKQTSPVSEKVGWCYNHL